MYQIQLAIFCISPLMVCIVLEMGIYIYMRFPEIGYPQIIHVNGIFHEINHPAMGVPPDYGNLHILT